MRKLIINHQGREFQIEPIGNVMWTTQVFGAGTLEFQVMKDGTMDFKEGDRVTFYVDENPTFLGYVFSKSRGKDTPIRVLCYDQLRYFRNKDTYTYSGITASQLLKMIVSDYGLNVGEITDTSYILPQRIEDNTTLFDIVYNAIVATANYNRQKYVLYDDFGKIALKNSRNMVTSFLANDRSVLDFNYETTIDKNVYNKIKLKHEKTTKYTHICNVYTAQDSEKIDEWGILQLYEHIDDTVDGNAVAQQLLSRYKTKNRTLELTTFSDISMRAGNIITVNLDIGDFVLDGKFFVDSCQQIYSDGEALMKLKVSGGVLNE